MTKTNAGNMLSSLKPTNISIRCGFQQNPYTPSNVDHAVLGGFVKGSTAYLIIRIAKNESWPAFDTVIRVNASGVTWVGYEDQEYMSEDEYLLFDSTASGEHFYIQGLKYEKISEGETRHIASSPCFKG